MYKFADKERTSSTFIAVDREWVALENPQPQKNMKPPFQARESGPYSAKERSWKHGN